MSKVLALLLGFFCVSSRVDVCTTQPKDINWRRGTFNNTVLDVNSQGIRNKVTGEVRLYCIGYSGGWVKTDELGSSAEAFIEVHQILIEAKDINEDKMMGFPTNDEDFKNVCGYYYNNPDLAPPVCADFTKNPITSCSMRGSL